MTREKLVLMQIEAYLNNLDIAIENIKVEEKSPFNSASMSRQVGCQEAYIQMIKDVLDVYHEEDEFEMRRYEESLRKEGLI